MERYAIVIPADREALLVRCDEGEEGIEQFGVEKMLDQMGAEKTVSRVAKQLLEKLEDNRLAKTAPHLYELVSSAGEEALEEFTETYADALVDALVDGDGDKR